MFPKKKCIGNEWVKFDPLFSQKHQDDTVRTIAHLTKTPRWHCENHHTSHKNTKMALWEPSHISQKHQDDTEKHRTSQKHQDDTEKNCTSHKSTKMTLRTIAHLTKTPRWNCENHRTFQKEAFLNNYSLVGIMLFIIPLKNFSNKN